MAEEKPQKSTLGDRMSDVGGMRVYRDGKWIPLEQLSKKPKEEPKPKVLVKDDSAPKKKPITASSYAQTVLRSSGGFGAPAEVYDPKNVRKAVKAAGHLVPEEQDLADALLEIVAKHGKFNADNTGVWAGYDSAEKNAENAKIGVKCGNCVFFNSPNGCSIIDSEVEEGGLCRFAVLPDGSVTPPALTADADYGDECPPATQDIVLNINNRQKAIDNVGYGPLNPEEPNDEFWGEKADRWNIDPVEAKKSICGNCVFFDRRPKTLDCIETGLAEGGSGEQSAWDSIDQAELGYCTALDFKCAASRTCNAWAAGGPITEDAVKAGGYGVGEDIDAQVHKFFNKPVYDLPEGLKNYTEEADEDYEYDVRLDDLIPTQRTVNMRRVEDVMGSDKPIVVWINEDGEPEIVDGHHRSVAYRLDGSDTIRAKAYKTPGFVATAGSKPAPKKDRIKGSDKNKKGSAASGRKITFSKAVETSLKEKVKSHNESVSADGKKVTLSMLKAVYRRGAGAFSTSHRPDQNRNSWAMGRVNAYLRLVKSGKPDNAKYTTDNDLLPKSHARSTRASIVASAAFEDDYESELSVVLLPETEYTSKEQAILSLAEFSGVGYEIMPALNAAWARAELAGENSFERAKDLATSLHESRDAELLPKEF
jgi:hypothetical protein